MLNNFKLVQVVGTKWYIIDYNLLITIKSYNYDEHFPYTENFPQKKMKKKKKTEKKKTKKQMFKEIRESFNFI